MQHKFPLTNILYHLFLYLIFLTPFTYASSYDSESEDVYFPDLRRSSLDETIETPQPKKSTVNRAHVHTLTSHIRFNANNWDVYLDALELIPEMHRPSPLPMHVYDFMKFASHLSIDEVLPFLEHYQTLTTPIKPGSHSTPVSYLVDFLYFIPQEYKKNVSNRLWALFSFMKKHPCHVLAPEVFRNQEMNQYQAYQIFDDVIGNLKTGWIPCTQNKKPSWKNFTLALNRASVLYQDQLFENEWNHGIDMLDRALTLAGEEAELLSAELKNNNFAYLALKIMTEIPETAKNVRDFFKFLHYLNNHDFPSIDSTNDRDNYFDFEDILDLMRLWFATGTDAYRQHPGEDVSQNWLLQGLSLITGDNLKPTIKALREAEKKGIPLTASPHFFACVATLPDALKSWLAVINVIFKYKHFTPAQEMVLFDFSSLRLVGEDRQEAILKAYVLSYYPTLVTLKERGLWTEDFTSFHNPNFPSMIKYMSLFPEENATDAATELAYISNACHAYNLKPLFKTLKKMPTPERLKALTRAFITAQEKPVKFMIHFYAQIYFPDFPDLKKKIIDQMTKPEIATVENIQKGLLETFFAIATAEEKQPVLNSWRRRIHDHSLVEGIFLHPDLFKKHDERLYSLAQYAEKLRLTDLIHTSTLEKRMKIARRVMEHPEKWAMTKQDDPLFIAAIHCTLPAFCQ